MTAQTAHDRSAREHPAAAGDAAARAGAPACEPAAGTTAPAGDAAADPAAGATTRRPLYSRLLRLRHLRLRGWQRVLLSDGSLLLAALLVLADLATAWTLLVLPLAVAAVVKLHDVAAGLLRVQTPTAPVPQDRRRRRRREG